MLLKFLFPRMNPNLRHYVKDAIVFGLLSLFFTLCGCGTLSTLFPGVELHWNAEYSGQSTYSQKTVLKTVTVDTCNTANP